MDEPKTSQTSSIDELVKELSRPKNTAPAPSNPPAPQEYQSSIRTMKDDMGKITSGGKVAGTTVPRKIEPSVPAAVSPKPLMPSLTPTPPKPVPETSPQAELGKSQKSVPLPFSPPVPRPPVSSPPPVSFPPPKISPRSESPLITVPEASPAGRHRAPLVFGAIAGVAALGGFFYWFLVLRNASAPVAVESPTPSVSLIQTPTPTPIITLASIFPDSGGTINLPASGDPKTDFNSQINNQFSVESGKFKRLQITSSAGVLSTIQIFDRFLINYPAGIRPVLASDSAFLLFGQQEFFNAKGMPLVSPVQNGKRIILISEVSDNQTVAAILKNWETTMAASLAPIFNLQIAKNKNNFLDNIYQGVSIRYRNFPYPDSTVDYAVVLAANGKSYLVIANSREAIYAVINQLSLRLF